MLNSFLSVLLQLSALSTDLHTTVYLNFYKKEVLSFFLFFLVLLIAALVCFFYFLRVVVPGDKKYATKLENTYVIGFVFFTVFLLVLSVLNLQSFVFIYEGSFTANKLFLILFLLIVPVTFTLLVRQEEFTTSFVCINFLFLLLVVFFLINTESLVGMVMGYELVFLPSFLIMRKTIYSASAQSAYSVFTVWSVLGSLIVVSGAVYLIVKTGKHSFDGINMSLQSWDDMELFTISLLFFIGFGVKIPIWPFHYWLTRVHVESSTGFSIFLSGFLVKAAVFVCWKVIVNLGIVVVHPVFILFCIFSVLDGALKLSVQTDIKKLVAFATVFEMGLIYLFLIWKPTQSFTFIFTFCFAHAFLSGLMFYLVDLIYTRTKTRSLDAIAGLSVFFPNLVKLIWVMLFIFWGLPFTVKFFIELWVLLSVFQSGSSLIYVLIVFILAFANIFVTKVWVNVMYGSPLKRNLTQDLNSWEFYFSFYLIFFSTAPSIVFTNLEL